jgi:hypothetical protein
MTRTWIEATRAFGIVRPASARRSRRVASVCLENLEGRLALSGFSSGVSAPLIKHGALPTAVEVQPMIIGNHIGMNAASEIKHGNGPIMPQDLNPQPLPPGFMASEAIQGQHIGYNAVQGQHIGTNIVGQHIGTSVMSTKFTVE